MEKLLMQEDDEGKAQYQALARIIKKKIGAENQNNSNRRRNDRKETWNIAKSWVSQFFSNKGMILSYFFSDLFIFFTHHKQIITLLCDLWVPRTLYKI